MSIVLLVALQGCQVLDVFGDDEPAEAEPSIEITQLPVDPAYPRLQTVPPRPQLSYSVEQHRKIVERLIGDREHARYTSQRIRYRAGLSSLPPPPAPEPEDAATSTAKAIVGERQETPASAPRTDVPTVRYGDISGPAGTDDASLGDFIRSMIEESEPTPPATAEPSPGSDAPQPGPEDSSSVNPPPGMSAVPSSHSSAAPPSHDRSATRLFAWIGDQGTSAAPVDAAGTVPSPEPASSEPGLASPPVDAAPIQAAALPRRNGAEVEAPREVAAVGEPAAAMWGTNGNAPAPGNDQGEASSATLAAAPRSKPEVQPASDPKPAPRPANGRPPDSTVLATITFADGSAELPADATARLEAALASLEGGDVIEIVGRGEGMTLALDRARAVAVGLMRLGAGAGGLKMTAESAPANDVRIRIGGRR